MNSKEEVIMNRHSVGSRLSPIESNILGCIYECGIGVPFDKREAAK